MQTAQVSLVILGAGQAGRCVAGLLDPNRVRLLAYGDNNPAVHAPNARPPVLSPARALALEPELLLTGVLDAERGQALEEQARALGYTGPVLRPDGLLSFFDIRSATLRRMARRLLEEKIPGNLAELGVYRGDFAWQLNALFPERRLYLFDSFSGFDERDLRRESRPRAAGPGGDFSDASADEVLARLPFPRQAVIRRGYFPDSAAGLEDSFALVSLDADLYAPTLAGLRFFYPRLSPGGVLFLHDYDSRQYDGVKRAVEEFESGRGPLDLVPLCDLHGTALIIKPRSRNSSEPETGVAV